jgi:cytochrome P450
VEDPAPDRPRPGSLDPFERSNLDDPHPFYARLRGSALDLIEVPERGVLVASKYDVCRSVLRDHGTFRSGLDVQWVSLAESGIRASFIENDPPEHARVRRSVQRWCTPTAIAELTEEVERVVDELVDVVPGALFRTLAQRVDGVEPLAGAARTDSAAIRGYSTLPVRVRARQGHR